MWITWAQCSYQSCIYDVTLNVFICWSRTCDRTFLGWFRKAYVGVGRWGRRSSVFDILQLSDSVRCMYTAWQAFTLLSAHARRDSGTECVQKACNSKTSIRIMDYLGHSIIIHATWSGMLSSSNINNYCSIQNICKILTHCILQGFLNSCCCVTYSFRRQKLLLLLTEECCNKWHVVLVNYLG